MVMAGNSVTRYDQVRNAKKVCKMKPDAKFHNPDPDYLRSLVDQAGVSRREASRLLGLSWPGFRNYLRDRSDPLYRTADYRVQFALECLASSASNQKE